MPGVARTYNRAGKTSFITVGFFGISSESVNNLEPLAADEWIFSLNQSVAAALVGSVPHLSTSVHQLTVDPAV